MDSQMPLLLFRLLLNICLFNRLFFLVLGTARVAYT